MTELDTSLRPTVRDILNAYGKEMTVRRRTRTYDPDTDATTVGAPVEYTVMGSPPAPVFVRELGKRDQTPEYIDVLPTDTEVWVAEEGAPVIVAEGDEFEFDNQKFSVVRVQPYYSGDLICARQVFLRGLK